MLCSMEEDLCTKTQTRRRRPWLLLLLLPYAALCFPQIYTRATPALWGFPFFYWYQFAWVIVTAALMGIVYWSLRDDEAPKQK